MFRHLGVCGSALWAVCILPGMAWAAPIQGGSATYEYYNKFTTRLYPGTPFNPSPDAVDLPVESRGTFTEVWQTQVGDTMAIEAVSAMATGELPGDPPVPFQILAGIQQTPQLGPFAGSYSQIVQNVNDPGYATGAPSSLQSAQRVITGRFEQVLAGGTVLYSGEPYTFDSTITGLPYPAGTVFRGVPGSADVPIRATGRGPGGDRSRDRRRALRRILRGHAGRTRTVRPAAAAERRRWAGAARTPPQRQATCADSQMPLCAFPPSREVQNVRNPNRTLR